MDVGIKLAQSITHLEFYILMLLQETERQPHHELSLLGKKFTIVGRMITLWGEVREVGVRYRVTVTPPNVFWVF